MLILLWRILAGQSLVVKQIEAKYYGQAKKLVWQA
uniref:Uncharacterized protein n=1 Tax=Setaria viridis TaxID=4556 RepID=A0A4U6WI96_SETVI|nr:hypothetical protein SEVIR_1G067566v2 [Setaria viridis]